MKAETSLDGDFEDDLGGGDEDDEPEWKLNIEQGF